MITDRSRDAIGVLALGTPIAAVSGWMAFLALPPGKAAIVSVGVLIATVALLARHRHPVASFTVVWLACALQGAVSGLFLTLPATAVFAVSLYCVAAWGRGWRRSAAFGGALVGTAAATWRLVTDPSVIAAGLRPDPFMVWGLLTAVAVAAAGLGMWRAVQLAYQDILLERAERAERDRAEQGAAAARRERQRIAAEMHDIVAHSLSVMVSQAQGGRYVAASAPDRATEALSTIETQGRRALQDMRSLLGVLRLDADGGADTPDGPQPTLSGLPDLLAHTRMGGRDVQFTESGEPQPLSGSAELAIYRLVQESLTNAVRHASARTHIEVNIRWDAEAVIVTIDNDEVMATHSDAGFGLIGMSQRIDAVGGTVSAQRRDEDRFTVHARIPYPDVASREPQ